MADVGEGEGFELRRSSRAQVSQAIAAVDGDGPCVVEACRRVVKNVTQRNVDRAANVRGLIFVRRQNVNELQPSRREHRGEFTMLNFSHG